MGGEFGAERVAGPLLWMRKNLPEVNRAKGLETVIRGLAPAVLVSEYLHDQAIAPRRPDRQKQFFVEGHAGLPASGAATNRLEEHLMLALFGAHRQGGSLDRPGGDRLRVVAYQVPLKARHSDPAGKVDGIALLDDGTPCLIELKAPNGRGDSPLRALLEGLSYAAVIQANRAAFDAELAKLHPDAAVGARLAVLVLGPEAWWQAWGSCRPAGDWTAALNELSLGLANQLELTIAFAALVGCKRSDLTLGLNGAAPVLPGIARLADVPGLPALPSPRARSVASAD